MVSQKTGGCSKQLQKVAAIGRKARQLILIRCRRQGMVAVLQKAAADGRRFSSTDSESPPTAGNGRSASKARCRRREVFVNRF